MKKLFGKKDKKERPASASDSTLHVPLPGRVFSSTERISISTSQSTTVNTVTSRVTSTSYTGGTYPRDTYKPVYERTKEWSNKFDRDSSMRQSYNPGPSSFNLQTSQRKHSVPISSYPPPSTTYLRPPPSPLAKLPATVAPIQRDARPFMVNQSTIPLPVSPYELGNELIVRVVKCKTQINHQQQRIPTYNTISRGKRGSLLVINNMKFEKNNKERKGAEKDVQNIKELFRQMNFDSTVKTNLKKLEMKAALDNYSRRNLNTYDVNVVIMMSHGCGDAASGSTEILGTDGISMPTTDVINYFTNANCPSLAGKPKIFIFQCCRGENEHIIFTDAQQSLGHDGDMLLAYATIPGFVSYRQEFIGSWYIQAICKVFMKNAHDTHVEDMLKMVDGALAEKAREFRRVQTSSYENRGFKCCYFNP